MIVGSSDPEFDRFVKGMIRAYQDLLEIDFEVNLETIEGAE
jgi:hypothetical protein